jgi:predicted nucleic acid-binding protein
VTPSRATPSASGATFARLDLITVPLGEELVAAAADARADLGCSLYDAFSAGLARLLEAPLYSADARAHGAYPGVRLITA